MPLRLPRGFSGKCRCAPERVARYRGKISGPLIDRIDIHIEVPAVPPEDLLRISSGESSAAVSARVTVARQTTRRGEASRTPSSQRRKSIVTVALMPLARI
jgi:magnesium chelatase family protein